MRLEIPKGTVHGVPSAAGRKNSLQRTSIQVLSNQLRTDSPQLLEHGFRGFTVVVDTGAFSVTFPVALSDDHVDYAGLSEGSTRNAERRSQRAGLDYEFNL